MIKRQPAYSISPFMPPFVDYLQCERNIAERNVQQRSIIQYYTTLYSTCVKKKNTEIVIQDAVKKHASYP